MQAHGKNVAMRGVQNCVFGKIDENRQTMAFAAADDDEICSFFRGHPQDFRLGVARFDPQCCARELESSRQPVVAVDLTATPSLTTTVPSPAKDKIILSKDRTLKEMLLEDDHLASRVDEGIQSYLNKFHERKFMYNIIYLIICSSSPIDSSSKFFYLNSNFPQRDRNLAVVHVRRGQHARHRHVAIRGRDVQLVSDPARRMALLG